MNTFEISGGEKLEGEIIPQGAKNECLQVLCAVLLTDQLITIKNIPDIIDVNVLINLCEINFHYYRSILFKHLWLP